MSTPATGFGSIGDYGLYSARVAVNFTNNVTNNAKLDLWDNFATFSLLTMNSLNPALKGALGSIGAVATWAGVAETSAYFANNKISEDWTEWSKTENNWQKAAQAAHVIGKVALGIAALAIVTQFVSVSMPVLAPFAGAIGTGFSILGPLGITGAQSAAAKFTLFALVLSVLNLSLLAGESVSKGKSSGESASKADSSEESAGKKKEVFGREKMMELTAKASALGAQLVGGVYTLPLTFAAIGIAVYPTITDAFTKAVKEANEITKGA
jgi:hypothetical protein